LVLNSLAGRSEPILIAHLPHHKHRLEEARLAAQIRFELEWDNRDLITDVHPGCRRQDESLHKADGFDEVTFPGGIGPEDSGALKQAQLTEGDAVVRVFCIRAGHKTKGLWLREGPEIADTKFDEHDST